MSLEEGSGLQKLFAEAKKNNRVKLRGNPDHYYPKLLIHKTKRASLYIFIPVVTFLITSVLFQDLKGNMDWTETFLPVLIFGSLLLVLPLSEEWEYKPWQSTAQQMERELKE